MPQYEISVDEDTVRGLFSGDGALAKLVEASNSHKPLLVRWESLGPWLPGLLVLCRER